MKISSFLIKSFILVVGLVILSTRANSEDAPTLIGELEWYKHIISQGSNYYSINHDIIWGECILLTDKSPYSQLSYNHDYYPTITKETGTNSISTTIDASIDAIGAAGSLEIFYQVILTIYAKGPQGTHVKLNGTRSGTISLTSAGGSVTAYDNVGHSLSLPSVGVTNSSFNDNILFPSEGFVTGDVQITYNGDIYSYVTSIDLSSHFPAVLPGGNPTYSHVNGELYTELKVQIEEPPKITKVGIYYTHDSIAGGLPAPGYPTTTTPVKIRAVVWADDGNGEKPYSSEAINNPGAWYAPSGTEVSFETPPPHSELAVQTGGQAVQQWPSDWPQLDFEWKELFNHGSNLLSGPPLSGGCAGNRNYYYDPPEGIPLPWGPWGTDGLTTLGTHRYRVKVTINKNTPQEQSKESPDKEQATRISFLNDARPLDQNGKKYLTWLDAYKNVPYEWGGTGFGGTTGTFVGGCPTDDGYGIDCSGLVSAGARWAGYNWIPWRANTKNLKNGRLSQDGENYIEPADYYSTAISPRILAPGDILLKAGSHVVTVVSIDSCRPNCADPFHDPDRIKVISAEGTPYNKVLVQQNKRFSEYQRQGYQARRLKAH